MREVGFSTAKWERLTNQDEREWRNAFVDLFEVQLQRMIEKGKVLGFNNLISEMPSIIRPEEYNELYERFYLEQGQKYYLTILMGLKGSKMSLRKKELDPTDPYFLRMREFLDEITATKVKTVEATSREVALNAIAKATEEAQEQGFGEVELVRRIEEEVALEWRVLSEFRAQRIARTEVTALANRASYMGAQNSELAVGKKWMAFIDSRTRLTHIDINGLEVGINERFPVGNSLLEYPGQYGGSAEETINCRCRLSWIVL